MQVVVEVIMGLTGTLFSLASNADKYAKPGILLVLDYVCWKSLYPHMFLFLFPLLCSFSNFLICRLFVGFIVFTLSFYFYVFKLYFQRSHFLYLLDLLFLQTKLCSKAKVNYKPNLGEHDCGYCLVWYDCKNKLLILNFI